MKQLAIHGGVPAVQSPLPAWPPQVAAIAESVEAALNDGSWGQYHGHPLDELMERMARRHEVRHVWPCASGTVGVELALRGCGVRPGQEVVMAGYDFPGNFRAVEAIGARPVLVDVQSHGWTMDVNQLAAAPPATTGAVLVSHLHGALLDMSTIVGQCRTANMPVVEDACQVPGATISGRAAGTWGDVGVFSFGGSKLLTAGRGGAVITDRQDLYQRIKIAAEHGNDAYPLSTLQAAALLPQWDLLDEWNTQRLQRARRICESLNGSSLFRTIDPSWDDRNRPAFYKFPLMLRAGAERETIIQALRGEGVPADAGFRGFVRRAPRRCRAAGSLAGSQQAAEQLVLLHHPLLLGGAELIDQVIEGLAKVEAWYRDESNQVQAGPV